MWSSGNLSPSPSTQNKSRSPSVTKQSEFFPQKADTNHAQSELLTDDNNNSVRHFEGSANSNPASRSQLSAQFLEDRTTKEVRNSLTLALNKKAIDGGYSEANNEDEETGNQKQSQNSEENEDNEDSNRPNVCGFYFVKFNFLVFYSIFY